MGPEIGADLVGVLSASAGLPLILFGLVLWVREGWLVSPGVAVLAVLVSLFLSLTTAVGLKAHVLLGAGDRAALAVVAGGAAGGRRGLRSLCRLRRDRAGRRP